MTEQFPLYWEYVTIQHNTNTIQEKGKYKTYWEALVGARSDPGGMIQEAGSRVQDAAGLIRSLRAMQPLPGRGSQGSISDLSGALGCSLLPSPPEPASGHTGVSGS